ncbi:MAG TPA: hypothetical protein VJR26_02885 [Candidatus Acidoferrales bacterium]|nr:hypothetical protein [Candidatus Acidoferrales bacterium]
MRRVLKWTGIGLVAVLAITIALGCYFMGGPRDLYGFLRYALPQWNSGNLRVGDQAPDATLYSLDGQSSFHLRDRIGKRPLVLIFGSYT